MSDVNKPVVFDKDCLLSPDQFKDSVAPIGSFPWAIIQVYLGKYLRRKDWSSPAQYIRLKPQTSTEQIYIEEHDKHGQWASWFPKQKDMVACDWEEVMAEGYTLSFDLKIGTTQYYNGGDPDGDKVQEWGYLATDTDVEGSLPPYGTLTNLQNTIGIGGILSFCLRELPIGTFFDMDMNVSTQIQPDLGSKNLKVVVNGLTYDLGSLPGSPVARILYTSDGAKKLGDLMKQNVDKTLHFCFNWK
ncbi:DUF2829 domain-containing protein [Xenorhabdus sp. 12]|uniref:DUF2829 domain-containing protein n=1 Tax=Xenorhabdus santafensis TaxID=2582833 RepID=A0ABU4SEN1_9GAMM|nr:MW1434 family type I TA system toxin [Xenorhabdus sp. 12]MDX7989248.1 DUF2829 domain-containing protein [Xenorhabdus sp. 12]